MMSINLSKNCYTFIKNPMQLCLQHRWIMVPTRLSLTNEEPPALDLILKYNPLNYYLSRLRMLQLRWTWDRNFRQHEFFEESKRAAVALTNALRLRNMEDFKDFSTTNIYHQLETDSSNLAHQPQSELLRFRTQDIQRVMPVNVHLDKIFGLKYAAIDVFVVGLRNVGDYESVEDLKRMKKAIIALQPQLKNGVESAETQLPYLLMQLFMRFRRNYSNVESISGQEMANHASRWLVSVYKIYRFNVLTL